MHAEAYRLVEQGTLVACCDRNAQNLSGFAREYHLHGYRSPQEMIEREKPDLVHLVTSPRQRVELMSLVSELGVPACIVEKPIALEVDDWRKLVDLEAQSQTRFAVGAQFRYHPDLTNCRSALQSGRLGKVHFLDCSAVGTICDQGVHVLDWAMSLNEDSAVTRVFGLASGANNLDHPVHPSPDTTVTQLKFANGVYGLWNLGHTAPRVMADEIYYKHCRVAAYAEGGHVLYEEFGKWEIFSGDTVRHGHVEDRGWREGNHQAQANLTAAALDWLEDDTCIPGTSLKRSLEQWNVILGLYASTIWHAPVDLPFKPPDDLWMQLNNLLAGGRKA